VHLRHLMSLHKAHHQARLFQLDAARFQSGEEQIEDQCGDFNREPADFFGVPIPEPA
jgi:hypothetical protein